MCVERHKVQFGACIVGPLGVGGGGKGTHSLITKAQLCHGVVLMNLVINLTKILWESTENLEGLQRFQDPF